MVIKTGKATVPHSAPGVVASLDVTVAGMTTSGNVVVSLAERDSAGDTRGQPDFYAVAGTGKITIVCEDKELQADTDVYWVADTDGTGATAGAETDPIVGAVTGIVAADGAGNISAAVAGTDYLAPNATADGTYAVYNDGVTSGQVTGFTVANGLITAVTVIP
jgi:hypothetical protein